MSSTNTKAKGFTIIEVVLVLAIAGLIFLVVFLALPALQRGQRDSQRKTDLGKFMSQAVAYQSNNQGLLPGQTTASSSSSSAAWNTFIANYLTVGSSAYADPSNGSAYAVTYAAAAPASAAAATPAVGGIFVFLNSRCGGTNGVETNAGTRNFAATIYQEQGAFYCQSNNN